MRLRSTCPSRFNTTSACDGGTSKCRFPKACRSIALGFGGNYRHREIAVLNTHRYRCTDRKLKKGRPRLRALFRHVLECRRSFSVRHTRATYCGQHCCAVHRCCHAAVNRSTTAFTRALTNRHGTVLVLSPSAPSAAVYSLLLALERYGCLARDPIHAEHRQPGPSLTLYSQRH